MTCQDENHIDEIVKYTPVRMQPYVYALCSEYTHASQSTCTGSYSYVATYNYLQSIVDICSRHYHEHIFTQSLVHL